MSPCPRRHKNLSFHNIVIGHCSNIPTSTAKHSTMQERETEREVHECDLNFNSGFHNLKHDSDICNIHRGQKLSFFL